jgi:hypothetical protein
MTEKQFIDPADLSEEENKSNADIGAFLANDILMQMNGMPPMIAYNMLANLVCGVFSRIEYEQPSHALDEFDNWSKTVREHLAGIIKERMQ